ncbi:transcriptional regulator, PadR family [Quadrisphaera granulorum]|uniref:PadR family transcriptional regulator n=1 Tax=Quadrisphaera granulorum TaxID=317664 RepID=A0A316A705_9ACTN|nr:PadR family transcriptional regulator [Quadrisphaera granulorum]PWJ53661.1 PadR family transcriptional regulator [Quadrisphaera granulorum]SZE96705.1 transcriptional regulator, PadR family [Quadrisphaera granulorum]
MSMAEIHLALLLAGPRHGYDLKHAHDAWFPEERPLAFGQVYATLARLVRDGLAEAVDTRSEGGPERTLYAVTDAGRERLLAWLATPAPPAGVAGEDVVRKTVVALHSAAAGADAAAVLSGQRTAHLKRMRELQRSTPPAPGSASGLAEHLARRHALLHLDADLRWLDEAVEALRTSAAHDLATHSTPPATAPDDSPQAHHAPTQHSEESTR